MDVLNGTNNLSYWYHKVVMCEGSSEHFTERHESISMVQLVICDVAPFCPINVLFGVSSQATGLLLPPRPAPPADLELFPGASKISWIQPILLMGQGDGPGATGGPFQSFFNDFVLLVL